MLSSTSSQIRDQIHTHFRGVIWQRFSYQVKGRHGEYNVYRLPPVLAMFVRVAVCPAVIRSLAQALQLLSAQRRLPLGQDGQRCPRPRSLEPENRT